MKVKRAIRTPEQVLEILSASPIGFLVESLRYGLDAGFDFENDPVAQGETVIGEMTEVERALHAAALSARRHAIDIAYSNNAMVIEALDENDTKLQHQATLNRKQYEMFDEFSKAFNAWCWYSVQKRIGIPATKAPIVSIRDGCVVVNRELKRVHALFESIFR